MSVAKDSPSVPMNRASVGGFPLSARVSAVAPEGLAPVRAIFAHGSEEVSIKVSDEGGGGSASIWTWRGSVSQPFLKLQGCIFGGKCQRESGRHIESLDQVLLCSVDLFSMFSHGNTLDLASRGIPRSVPCLQLLGVAVSCFNH